MIWRISSDYLTLHPPRLYALPFFRSLLVEEGHYRLPVLPLPPEPPPYPGFGQYVKTIEQKGKALPALLTRSDGETLLYAGKVNTVFGEPGMSKTWIAIKAAIEAIEHAGRVLWWDFEDKPDTLFRRVESLVLQRQFREGCGVMPAWRRGAWHGSVWPVRYCPAYPQATAATRLARTVPGAAFPAPPGRPAAS